MNSSRGWTEQCADTIRQFKYLILYAVVLFEPSVYGFLDLLFMLLARSANIVAIWPRARSANLVDGAIDEGKDGERAVVQPAMCSRGTVVVVPKIIFLHVRIDCLFKFPELREEVHQFRV